jgi:hypothetical protein
VVPVAGCCACVGVCRECWCDMYLIDPFRADEDSASRQDSGRRQRLATRQRTKMLTPYKTSDKDFDIGQKYMKPPVFVCRHQKRTNLRHATRTRNTIGVLKARNLTDRCTKTPSLSSHFAKSTNKTCKGMQDSLGW